MPRIGYALTLLALLLGQPAHAHGIALPRDVASVSDDEEERPSGPEELAEDREPTPTDYLAPPPPEAPTQHEFLLTRSVEDGVTDRVLLDYFGRFNFHPSFSLEAAAGLSAVDHWGLDLFGLSGVAHFRNAKSDLVLSLQHEAWPAWRVTENRLQLYWNFHPIDRIAIAIGGSYRTPEFNSTFAHQWFSWWGSSAEWSIVYRFHWKFAIIARHTLAMVIHNLDRMRLHTPDDVHFMLEYGYRWRTKTRFVVLAGTASKGVSGGILSWGQSWISAGVHYDLQ